MAEEPTNPSDTPTGPEPPPDAPRRMVLWLRLGISTAGGLVVSGIVMGALRFGGGSGAQATLTIVLSGLAAFALAYQVLRGVDAPQRSMPVTDELIVTLIATLLGGLLIAMLHVPSGH